MKSFGYRFLFLLALSALPLLAQPKPKIESDSRLPDAHLNTSYITTLSVRGGTAPYMWDVVDGSLPQGIILIGFTGTVGGIPIAAGDFNVTIRVTDASSNSDSQAFRIKVIGSQPGPSIDTTSLPAGVVGTAYAASLTASSGTPPYTWSISAGTLPTGISLDGASGALSGTPTTAGNVDFTAQVADSASQSATKQLRITVNPAASLPPSITTSALINGTVGQTYSGNLAATGGTPPYSWSISAGTLPTGLSISSAGVISGTPTAAGPFDFTAQVADSASQSATKPLRITINPAPPPPLSITTSGLSAGTVGQAYSGTLSATGGVPPLNWTVSAGALPGGLSLSSTGAISGAPTTAGNFDFTARVADSASQSATKPLRITINPAPPAPLSITTSALSPGTVGQAYSGTLSAAGGTPPLSWSVSAGALPTGLTLSAGGAISGTPTTAGDFDFTARAGDAAGQSATKPLRITINPPPAAPLNITTAALNAGTVGQGYSATLSATGGTPPLTWSISAGSLPAGLNLSAAGAISGAPTASGDSNFTVRVADSASQSATRQLRITINAAIAAPSITTTTLPNTTAGVDYSQVVAATGGRAPYTWSISAGALPAGLKLDASTGRISGSATNVGSFSFTVRATDADARVAERAFTIAVVAALAISGCPVPSGIAGVNYSSSVSATGGTPPYTWSVAGQVPTGITLTAANGLFGGLPTAAGAFNFTLSASDAGGRQATRACTITISLNLQILNDALPDATTRATYSATLLAAGGTTPYRWTTISGALPPGLLLNESSGAIAGQPTQPGRFNFTIQLTDAAGAQLQRSYTINVVTGLTIPSCPTPIGAVSEAYTSTLAAVGGQSPYSWALDSGTLPPGLRLAADTGVLAGTPTAPGSSEFSLRASDSGVNSATRTCSIQIAPELTITTVSLPQTEAGAAYAASLAASGGTPPYTWSITTGSLGSGLSFNAASGQISGTPTAPGVFRFTARVTDSAGVQEEKQFDLTVGNGFAIAACPTPTVAVGEPYSSSLSTAGGDAPIAWAISSGALPAGIALNAQTGTVTGAAGTIGSSGFVVSATDAKSRTATRACSIAVTATALTISQPAALPDALLGVPYQQALQAVGGRAPYTWSVLSGSLPPGLSLTSAGVINGSATTVGTTTVTIQAGDADQRATTRAFDLRVLPAKAPGLSFMDLPDIVPPAQQPVVRLKLDNQYPTALHGELTLKFTPDPGLNVDDPAVRFVTGQRTVSFDVAENTTDAVFAVPQLALQTGSVAGMIELSARITSGDLDVTPDPAPTRTVRIDRTAPVITNVSLNRVTGGFEVIVTGFSTTREVTSATFQFTPAAGSRLEASQVAVQTDAAAKQWFSDARSAGFGSQFTFVQPFSLQNATLSEVSVTLTNAQGTSQAVRARF